MQAYTLEIFNYHLDGYRHVNNARYLEFLEAARWDFFRQHGMQEALRLARLVVAQSNIRYRRPAELGDILHIHSRIAEVQSRKIHIAQTVCNRHRQTCVEAGITLMPTDEQGRVFRLPENLLDTFQTLIQTP